MSEPTNPDESETPEEEARRPALSFGDDTTSPLPHWSEPATGEVPVFGASAEGEEPPQAGRSRLFPQLPDDPNLVDASSPTDVFRPVDQAGEPDGPDAGAPDDQADGDAGWAAPRWAGEEGPPQDEPDRTVAPPAGGAASVDEETRPLPVVGATGSTADTEAAAGAAIPDETPGAEPAPPVSEPPPVPPEVALPASAAAAAAAGGPATEPPAAPPPTAPPSSAPAAAAGTSPSGGTPSWQDEVIWPAESLNPTNPESERLIFGEDMDEPVQVGRGRWSAGAARDMAFGADPGDGERNLSIAVGVGLVLAGALLFLLSISPGAAMILVTVALWAAAIEFFTTVRRVGYRPATLLGSVTVAGLALAVFWQGEAAYPLVLALFTVTGLLWYLAEADGERPTSGLAITSLGVVWVGVLGSFAAIILTLGEPATGIFLGAIIGTVAYDVGAYAIGRLAGSSQLAPDVSPNKTWEGLIGGMIAAIVVCTVLLGIVPGLSPWDDDGALDALWLGITVAVAAPVGDLCQSLVKRDLGVKDMGTLLPGHGGVLDRFDALLFVLPAVYYLARLVIF